MSSFAVYERYYADNQSPLGRKKSRHKHNRQKGALDLNRILSVLIIFLLLVLIGELVFHLVITPRLVLKKVSVDIDGYYPYGNEEILRIAGLEGGVSFLGVRERDLEEKLIANPMIKDARVKKQFPHSIAMSIVPRAALASVLVDTGNSSIPLCVDREGYIIAAEAGENKPMPVISGVRFVDARPGMRFPEELVRYLEQLSDLKAASPELFSLISEIKFVKKSTTDYEVVLFPGHARVRVRTGPEINPELLKGILLVIDVVQKQGLTGSLAELDFRAGEVVYRTRGG
ncbi:FtsQ-type POTRA domain-containing protein [Marispirochaeta aestuarii]|uniref:cell division protein FtsQ/DivIB n=1 Tax=Marispirochaeta aestuarii TaxID=1963862 RepID=UPI0029C6A856|nr:FtsQ-type POTRA domain-containing protein [Marispirochaeta aestuarii]